MKLRMRGVKLRLPVASIRDVEQQLGGRIGVSLLLMPDFLLGYREEEFFQYGSVGKVGIAMYALWLIEKGLLTRDELIRLDERDRNGIGVIDSVPGPMAFSVMGLIDLTLKISANVAADELLRQVGGPEAVTAFMRGQGLPIVYDRYYSQMIANSEGFGIPADGRTSRAAWKLAAAGAPPKQEALEKFATDLRDVATPRAMVELLHAAVNGSCLGPEMTRFLRNSLRRCQTSDRRIRGVLNDSAYGAYGGGKTGSIGRTATDVALIEVPQVGATAILAVSAQNVKKGYDVLDEAIVEVARLAMNSLQAALGHEQLAFGWLKVG